MATAEVRPSASRWWWLLPALLVLGAGAIGLTRRSAAAPAADRPPTAETVAVRATSAQAFTSLADLVAASDLVVRGHVVATSRGRLVGDGASAVVSRVLTVQVDEVLGGTAPSRARAAPSDTLLIEEEGWLPDGREVAVNGVAPTQEGEHGVWFLVSLDDPDLPGYITVGTQGRYLLRAGALQGGDPDDALVQTAARLGEAGLSDAVRSAAGGSPGGSIAP